jgi:Flp pilus assembly protein TadD
MRRFMTISVTLLVAMFIATAATAQVRGRGRLQGMVTDKNTGAPVVGATVTVAIAAGNTEPIISKTDARGHWSALGLVSGQWNIDITAPGYQTTRGSASVSEMQQQPMIQTKLAAEEKQEAPAAAAIAPSPVIPREAADAIDEGQALLKLKEGDVVTATSTTVSHTVTANEVRENAKKATADFEKALPLVPTDKPEAKTIHDQLLQVMAQAYYRAGDVKSAVTLLQQYTTAEPTNVPAQVLLANLYLENGQLDEGRQMIEKLPAGAITDPTAYVNVGILFFNKKNPTDAITYFSKAILMNPKSADGYYYRGLAEAQLKKTAEARADFGQVITLSPDSPEAKDAKAMLDSLPRQ